jgi:hypothetical protein
MIKSLSEQREKKKKTKEQRLAKKIAEDLEVVLKTLNLTLDALGHYKKYIPVMEVMSSVQTNRTLMEIQLKKYEKMAGENVQG